VPDEQAPPTIPEADLDSEQLKLYFNQIDQGYALSLVNQTFNKYETDRTTNHDYRWNNNDTLYWGWVQPKVWEGTNIARSSLSHQLVFDQLESALPSINSALFAGGGEDWFQVLPEIGATPQDARQVQAALDSPTKAIGIVDYATVADFANSFIFSGGSSIQQKQTDIDRLGNRISLSYTYPGDYELRDLFKPNYENDLQIPD